MKVGLLVGMALLAVATAPADEVGARAWQQRLELELPVAIPLLELTPANPFAVRLDRVPERLEAVPPRKQPVAGRAVVAAYVDAKGSCIGSVPLETAFPGLTAALVATFGEARFEPARIGTSPQPSWVVIELKVGGTVKESGLLAERLELPDPERPAQPTSAVRMAPPGALVAAPAAAADQLTVPATPKKINLRASAQEVEVPLRALIRVSPAGRCDRYVPLELDSGLAPWLEAFLASWKLEPAALDGAPVESWMLYTARARLVLSSLESTGWRALPERTYSPAE